MSIKAKMTLPALNVDFDTDSECREALEQLRWPEGVKCLRCGSESISRITTRRQYDCNACRYRFSVTTGTVFNDSHLALSKWFLAVLLMCEAKKGISANQLKRTLGVAQKTAWYLCHRIRKAMTEVHQAQLAGTVEVDETYVGGKGKGKGHHWRDRRMMVLGALERGGRIVMRTGHRDTSAELKGWVKEAISDDAARIMTDENRGYHGIEDDNTTHETVVHSKGEYVRGDVHTNGIEGAFGLFKRSLVGSFHHISFKHMDRYLDEFEFKYNNRKNAYLFRDTLQKLVQTEAIPYEQLTA
jgi:transposase-like protein